VHTSREGRKWRIERMSMAGTSEDKEHLEIERGRGISDGRKGRNT